MTLASDGKAAVRVLVITGGHDFDTIEFFNAFHALEGIRFDSVSHPQALEMLRSKRAGDYDVLVFYDFIPGMPGRDSLVYGELTRQGKPMLFLHHSLCSFQQWDGYMEMVGGRYYMPDFTEDSLLLSDYKHDIDIPVHVADQSHPVTAGLDSFTIHDEGYSNIKVLPGVKPLLLTEHPDCLPVLGWINTQDQSTVVYLMLGHDKHAYQHPAFRQLVQQAIHWLASP